MRVAERSRGYDRAAARQSAGNRMDYCCFKRFFKRHLRQYCGQPLRKHTFTRTRRAHKQHIMTARSGNFKCSFSGILTLDFAKVDIICALLARYRRKRYGQHVFFAAQMRHQFAHRFNGINRDPVNHRCFTRISGRQKNSAKTVRGLWFFCRADVPQVRQPF